MSCAKCGLNPPGPGGILCPPCRTWIQAQARLGAGRCTDGHRIEQHCEEPDNDYESATCRPCCPCLVPKPAHMAADGEPPF